MKDGCYNIGNGWLPCIPVGAVVSVKTWSGAPHCRTLVGVFLGELCLWSVWVNP